MTFEVESWYALKRRFELRPIGTVPKVNLDRKRGLIQKVLSWWRTGPEKGAIELKVERRVTCITTEHSILE
jgi:hypothetical protein